MREHRLRAKSCCCHRTGHAAERQCSTGTELSRIRREPTGSKLNGRSENDERRLHKQEFFLRTVERTPYRVLSCLGAGLIIVLLGGGASEARGQASRDAGHGLGMIHFPISCSEHARV